MSSITMLDSLGTDADSVTQAESKECCLPEIVMDLSNPEEIRMDALERYCEEKGDDAIDLFSHFTGMYQFSGISVLQDFLYLICTHGHMSPFLRLEAAQSLLSYEEDEFYEEDDDEVEDPDAVQRNQERLAKGYKALDHVCYDLKDPTPRRVEAITTLMESKEHKTVANAYFREMVNDQDIECDYRYKCILSLENKDQIPEKEFFIEKACLEFLFCDDNKVMYRILAAQKLMQMGRLVAEKTDRVCSTILGFARDTDIEYNLRADAADMILGVAPEEMKKEARKIIGELAGVFGKVKTVFDNAQNVHTAEIDKSLAEGLKQLAEIPLIEVDKQPITFHLVQANVMELVKVERHENADDATHEDNTCPVCGVVVESEGTCSEPCEENHKCKISLNRIAMDRYRYSSFNFTLSHILLRVWSFIECNEYKETLRRRLIEELCDMCGTCSTGFAARLINVMSGFGDFNMRVSWGDQITANFIGRLNAFARRIVDEDSIFRSEKLDEVIELFLNQNPCEKLSLKTYTNFVQDQSRRAEEQYDAMSDAKRQWSKQMKEMKEKLENGEATEDEYEQLRLARVEMIGSEDEERLSLQNLMKDMIQEFKDKEDSAERIEEILKLFSENVINEMVVTSSQWSVRPNFLLFFGSVMLRIREEMYEEFKDHITDTDYDLYFRIALSTYEGEA